MTLSLTRKPHPTPLILLPFFFSYYPICCATFFVQAKKVTKELLNREGCNPYKVAILPWVQIPLWIVISFAIRNMSRVFPGMTPLNPDISATLSTEGTLWFRDLTLTDPYYILPCVLVITNFLNIEVGL